MRRRKMRPRIGNGQVAIDERDSLVAQYKPDPAEVKPTMNRFKRVKPRDYRSRLTEEREMALCVMYADHPEMSVFKISDVFGVTHGTLNKTIQAYNVPLRQPQRVDRRRKARVLPSVTYVSQPQKESYDGLLLRLRRLIVLTEAGVATQEEIEILNKLSEVGA